MSELIELTLHSEEWYPNRCVDGRTQPTMSPAISAAFFAFLTFSSLAKTITAPAPRTITFHSPNLFPESAVWDPISARFLLGSTRRPTLLSLSDDAALSHLASDPNLPPNVSFLGLALDSPRRRLLVAVAAPRRFPPFDALAAYDLSSGRRVFLSRLSSDHSDRSIANGVAVDRDGNAFITGSLSNVIWKVNPDGVSTVFSTSPIFHDYESNITQERRHHYSWCGLNGIAYAGDHLLTVQTNTGRLFKVDAADGTARVVRLERPLAGAEAVAVRRDGAAAVMAQDAAWLLRTGDEWVSAVVEGEVELDLGRFPTGVVVREGMRAYVLYGRVNEGMAGGVDRDEFSLEEVFASKEAARTEKGRAAAAVAVVVLGVSWCMLWRYCTERQGDAISRKRA